MGLFSKIKDIFSKKEEQAKEFAENISNTMVLKTTHSIDYCENDDVIMQLI